VTSIGQTSGLDNGTPEIDTDLRRFISHDRRSSLSLRVNGQYHLIGNPAGKRLSWRG